MKVSCRSNDDVRVRSVVGTCRESRRGFERPQRDFGGPRLSPEPIWFERHDTVGVSLTVRFRRVLRKGGVEVGAEPGGGVLSGQRCGPVSPGPVTDDTDGDRVKGRRSLFRRGRWCRSEGRVWSVGLLGLTQVWRGPTHVWRGPTRVWRGPTRVRGDGRPLSLFQTYPRSRVVHWDAFRTWQTGAKGLDVSCPTRTRLQS